MMTTSNSATQCAAGHFQDIAASPPTTLADHLFKAQRFSLRLHFGRGEILVHEGDPADKVFKIVSGIVRICRHTADGRRCIADFLLPGDLLGFLECPDQPTTAEAVTAVTVVAYPRSRIDELAQSDSALRTRIACHLSAALLEAQHQLFVLSCQSAKERLASFLLRLASRMDVRQGDPLHLLMTRQDIADHLGLTIETVSRSFSALRNDRVLIIPASSQLIIADMGALRRLALED